MTKNHCIVLGGGLAGLTAARSLAHQGWKVTLVERASHLGGKAAAVDRGGPVLIEHGYHVFPRWYENVRGLLEEISKERIAAGKAALELVNLTGFHYLKAKTSDDNETPEQARERYVKVDGPSSIAAFKRNIFDSLMPWYFQSLYLLSVLDLLRERLGQKSLLDRVSQIGFIRDKFYATENLAALNQENMLKASAIPAYEMSTMTAKTVANYWAAQPNPFVSILPGDLQTWFITPLGESAKQAGVEIRHDLEVTKLDVGYEKIDGEMKPVIEAVAVRPTHGVIPEQLLEADAYVLATPVEVTRKLITDEVYEGDPELGNVEHIETEPMSALHLFVDQPPAELGLVDEQGVPRREHVFFTGSHYGLSFIDNSQWPGMDGKSTYLSFIASNFSPLREVNDERAVDLLLEEIHEYIPLLDRARITKSFLNRNTETPLYINTVGSWANRPRADSAIDNLFIAGDYVKNCVDLACMEGAVASGLMAAHVLSRQYHVRSNGKPGETTLVARVRRALDRAREPLPSPTRLLPPEPRLTQWSRKLRSVLEDSAHTPAGVAPPPIVPFVWPRQVYQALYAAMLSFPGTWLAMALAKLDDERKIDHSLVKQAANKRFRLADYRQRLAARRPVHDAPRKSYVAEIRPRDERQTG